MTEETAIATSARTSILAVALVLFAAVPGCSGTDGGGSWSNDSTPDESTSNDEEPAKGDVYGEDDRLEYTESESEALKRVARASAVLLEGSKISPTEGDRVKLPDTTLTEDKNICSSERFSEQPAPGHCSGFLVGPDLLVTAGHCIRSSSDCESTRAVFGFRYDESPSTSVTELPKDNIYRCKSLIEAKRDTRETRDYAVVRLDRPVEGIEPLPYRTDGTIPEDAPLAVVGHPMGLPVKITAGGEIVDNSAGDSFLYNLDAFGGHSGAAVVHAETGLVEGLHVRGAPDYERTTVDGESCQQIRKCDEVDTESDNCFGTAGSRSTLFAPHIPPSGTSSDAPGACCRVCVTGKACGDTCVPRSTSCARPNGCACDAPVAQPPGANADASPSSCAGVLHCLDDCGSDDQNCRADCLATANAEGFHNLRALASCQERRCEDSDLDSCAEASCPRRYDACSADGETPERANLTCGAIYDCYRSCDDNPCKSGCYDAGTSEGRSRFDALMECSRSNDCGEADDPRACLRTKCPAKSDRCFR